MADEAAVSRPAIGTAARVGLVAWLIYAATTGGSYATDLASYEVTKALVDRGSVAMSYDVLATEAERGVDGRYYAPVGLGHALFGVPFYAASKLAARAGLRVGKSESIAKAAVVFGSTVAAAGCVFFACLLAWYVSGDRRTAMVTAFTLAFATPLWVYAKFGFNAPLAAVCLTAGATAAWIGVRRQRDGLLMASGCAIGYAVLTRHEMILGALPILLWCWLETRGDRRRRVRALALFALPVAAGAGAWMFYNYTRFGHPFDTGLLRDPNVGLDTPLVVGLHGLLFSPGRSLLLYAPISLAAVVGLAKWWRHDRSTAVLLGTYPMVFLLFIAKMHQWDGGESYGPRYLVPVLPFLAIAGVAGLRAHASPRARAALIALMTLGVVVQIPGVLVDYSKAQLTYARTQTNYSIALTRYTWEGAPLVLNTKAARAAVPENLSYLIGGRRPPAVATSGGESDRGFSQQFAFSLDFWWLYLFYLGAIPAWASLAAPLALLGAAIMLYRTLP